MTDFPYGRFAAVEHALGGRAAIAAAFHAGQPLVGPAGLGALRPAFARDVNTWGDQNPHFPNDRTLANLVIVQASLAPTAGGEGVYVTCDVYEDDGSGGWANDNQVGRADYNEGAGGEVVRIPIPFIVPVGWGYIPRPSSNASLLYVTEQPLG